MDLRAQLEDLARRLHLIDDDERAADLGARVQRSIEPADPAGDADDHEDLGERLTDAAVHFETAHPELADVLRRVADALSASGL